MGVEMNAVPPTPNVVPPTPQERLQERLSDPRTVESLNRVLDRLDLVAFSFDAIEGFLQRAEVVVESLASGLAELRPVLAGGEGGEDWISKVPRMARTGARLSEAAERVDWDRVIESGLLEKLSDPGTLESLGTLLEKAELMGFLLEGVDGFLRRSEAMAESLAEGTKDLRQSLPQVDATQLRKVSERLPELIEAGEVLAQAGMFEPSTVQVLGELGRSIAESHHEIDGKREGVGLFGLFKALRDPMVQNTLLLAVELAKRYGAQLERRKAG